MCLQQITSLAATVNAATNKHSVQVFLEFLKLLKIFLFIFNFDYWLIDLLIDGIVRCVISDLFPM